MESLQNILARQHRGIGVLRDELAGWIGAMEKYSNGRGNAADRAFWLQSYNGASHVVDRATRGAGGISAIENLLTTVCGGIQPERLQQFRDLGADGLWQRFVPIIVGPTHPGHDERATRAVADYAALIQHLLAIPDEMHIQLTEDAHAVREEVCQQAFNLEQSELLGPHFASFCGKLPGIWGRLALVLACIDAKPYVTPDAARAAQKLVFTHALPSAARAYASAGGAGTDGEATRSIEGFILVKKAERMVVSDLTRNVRACRNRSVEDVQRLISPLVAGGWLTPEREFNPTSWRVAQLVHLHFADRAETEARRRERVRELIIGTTDDEVE